MRPRRMAAWPADCSPTLPRLQRPLGVFFVFLVHTFIVTQVEGSGVFELHLQSFRNDKGLNQDGNCCNGYRSEGACSAPCRTFFKVCLTHYQADITTELNPQCTFGEYTSPVVADNSLNFSAQSSLPMDNPLKFPVSEFSWPGDFSLIVEAWHDTTLTGPKKGSPRELISRLAVQQSAAAGADWYNSKRVTRFTELVYSYRFICDKHYYGATCDNLCRPREDQFGHYYCSENGTKVCLDGWQGEYCERAICMADCHPDNGFCDKPNECRCRLGWEGQHCNVCIPYPGCQHGTCKRHWECNCEEGWGGLFCNQDLNYCTHHLPCKNGATCTNTRQGSYTCTCRPGYNGTNCEVEVNHCQDQPCLHGGTCHSIETGYTCSCMPGYFGDLCEQEANYCRTTTCFNGGTCVDHTGSYQCLCAQGYAGFHCEEDTGGCKKDSCKNGGQCVSGNCICPTGFYGPTCEDDGHDYCAHKPCLNGGTCIDLNHDFECRCVAGFVGPTCEINVDDCDMRPCANGGRCVDLINDFRCHCAPGWAGKDCSVNEDNCRPQPCRHGGTCLDRIDDYQCTCPDGFWGKDCHLYEGMSTTPTTRAPPRTSKPNVKVTEGKVTPKFPQATTEDPLHHSGNISGQAGTQTGEEDALSTSELLVVVCVGAGLPILLIIVVVAVLLCRKRRHLAHSHSDGMDKERQQNYINNMNNRGHNPIVRPRPLSGKDPDREAKCIDDDGPGNSGGVAVSAGGMGGGGSPLMSSSSAKVEMEGGGSGGGGGGGAGGQSGAIFTTSYPPPSLPSTSKAVVKVSNEEQQDINRLNARQHRQPRDKAGGKNFLRDSLGADQPYPRPNTPASPASHRDSYVYDYDKPIRRLDVDTLSEDTKMDISTYHRHSGDISIIVKPKLPAMADRENARGSVYLEPAHPRHSHYAEDYLATEV